MANTTRMRLYTNVEIFHREDGGGDMPEHDILTSDATVRGLSLGGVADFELESDTAVDHLQLQVSQDTTEVAIGSGAITDYIFIKNTGFTSGEKTTEVAEDSFITVGIGGNFANGGIALYAGQAICLHHLGGGSDNFSEIKLDSSVASTFVEIVKL